MAKIVVELTNRCNLSCQHCFSGRHGGRDDLPLEILKHVLAKAKAHGFDQLSFTGGDPTVYRHFWEAIRLTTDAGYRFALNTNGWNFSKIFSRLLFYREQLAGITFSLDGATEATHDRLRGQGSFRRVMQAVSICVMKDIPFTFNMVITAHNRHEVGRMANLAGKLGSRGLRYGHLMPAPITTEQGFDLSPWDRKVIEVEIWQLRREAPITIAMAPGYHTTDLFPCAPLNLQEINIDCHGNLTQCCHLSGHGNGIAQGDVIGNLAEMSFGQAYARFLNETKQFRQAKMQHLASSSFRDSDFFPCWYCSLHHHKVDWLEQVEGHPWRDLL